MDAKERNEKVLAIVRDLQAKATGYGAAKAAPWEDIASEGAKLGLTDDDTEEALNALLDAGSVYEPILGRIKVI